MKLEHKPDRVGEGGAWEKRVLVVDDTLINVPHPPPLQHSAQLGGSMSVRLVCHINCFAMGVDHKPAAVRPLQNHFVSCNGSAW